MPWFLKVLCTVLVPCSQIPFAWRIHGVLSPSFDINAILARVSMNYAVKQG